MVPSDLRRRRAGRLRHDQLGCPAGPGIIGPWFLWRLLVDEGHQRRGYGRAALDLLVDLIRAEGATELLTSYVPGDGEPWPFYERLGLRTDRARWTTTRSSCALDLSGLTEPPRPRP